VTGSRARTRRARLPLLIAVVVGALLAAGCGGDDTSEASGTTDWADGVCTAITTWTESLTAAAASATADPSREGLEGAVADVESATETLQEDLKGLGEPDTEAGEEAQQELEQLSGDLSEDVQKIETAVEDVSGASDVLSATSTVSGTLVSMGDRISSAFEQLEQVDGSDELRDAFEQADACTDLRRSAS
jgi:uncharacterized protein YoxC